VATVSLVVNGKAAGRVSSERQEDVRRAVAKLGYRVDARARGLVTGRTSTVALVLPDLSSPYFGDLTMGVSSVLGGSYDLVLTLDDRASPSAAGKLDRIVGARVEGVICHASSDETVAGLSELAEAIVLLDEPGTAWRGPTVLFDLAAGADALAGHLRQLGHRRVAYLHPDIDAPTFRVRRDSLRRHFSRRSFEELRAANDVGSVLDVLRRALASGLAERVTAIVCGTDDQAYGALLALSEAGLSVPADVSVAGFNDLALSSAASGNVGPLIHHPRALVVHPGLIGPVRSEVVVSREGLRVREVSNEEGNRLLRIVRRSSGSVVTWRRAQMVLLSVQGMDVAGIAKVTFTSPDRVRAVLNNFNQDGFESLYPKYSGGRPLTFTLPQRQQIKKIALSRPVDHGLPFSTWSLVKLADFLVAEGVVEDISHEGLREVLQKEEVSFQAVKTWKQSDDPDYEAKKNRVLELYDIAEGKAGPGPGDPTVVFSMDEFGPLNLLPRAGKQWAPVVRRRSKGSTSGPRRRRLRATYSRTKGGTPPARGAGHERRQALRAHKNGQRAHDLPRLLPVPVFALPSRGAYRHRLRQLQPPPVDQKGQPGRRLGGRQQRGAGLRADKRFVPQPHRVPLHGPALFRPQRDRPPQPRRTELDDPPLYRLAQPQPGQ